MKTRDIMIYIFYLIILLFFYFIFYICKQLKYLKRGLNYIYIYNTMKNIKTYKQFETFKVNEDETENTIVNPTIDIYVNRGTTSFISETETIYEDIKYKYMLSRPDIAGYNLLLKKINIREDYPTNGDYMTDPSITQLCIIDKLLNIVIGVLAFQIYEEDNLVHMSYLAIDDIAQNNNLSKKMINHLINSGKCL